MIELALGLLFAAYCVMRIVQSDGREKSLHVMTGCILSIAKILFFSLIPKHYPLFFH